MKGRNSNVESRGRRGIQSEQNGGRGKIGSKRRRCAVMIMRNEGKRRR